MIGVIYVDRGNGDVTIDEWTGLWIAMWSAIAHAIHFDVHGRCRCGCQIADCAYCIGQCWEP